MGPMDKVRVLADGAAVATLAARYHHDDGRPHRLTVSVLPPSEGDVMNDPTRPERVATATAVA